MMDIVIFTVIACAGFFVMSIVGFGAALVSVPILTIFFSPKEAIPTYTFLALFIELVLVMEARGHIYWPRLSRIMIGGLVGMPIGAMVLKYLPAHAIQSVISTATLVFALLFLFGFKFKLKETAPAQLGTGLFSGILGGAIAQPGTIVAVYGTAVGWDKNTFRASLLTYFLMLSAVGVGLYLILGLFSVDSLVTTGAAFVPGLLTARLGVMLKDKINEKNFRYTVLAVILVVGLIGLGRRLLQA